MTVRALLCLIACAGPALAAAEPVVPSALPSGADPAFRERMLSWSAPLAPAVVREEARPIAFRHRLSSTFGVRVDPFNGTARRHLGIDMPGVVGTPVHAAADGVVAMAGRAGGYGNLVTIEHAGGLETRYGHLSAILVAPGAAVRQGDLVGLMGSTGRSTGSHLHFEVRVDGVAENPLTLTYEQRTVVTPPSRPAELRWGGWAEGDRLPTSVLK